MYIPQGTLSHVNTCEVAITALGGCEFHFPEHTELVSAVYAISLSEPLLGSVQLEIQHCVSLVKEEHLECLSFVTSSLEKSAMFYDFTLEDGGTFNLKEQYGSLSLSHFCLKAIVKKLLPWFISDCLSSSGSTSSEEYFDASEYPPTGVIIIQ